MLNFPANPSNNQLYPSPPQVGVPVFRYIESAGVWVRLSSARDGTTNIITNINGASVTVSETAPTEAEVGDLWWDNINNNLHVYVNGSWQLS